MTRQIILNLVPIFSILAFPWLSTDCDTDKVAPNSTERDSPLVWRLVFEDEFEGKEMNDKIWEKQQSRSSPWNKYVNPDDNSLVEVKNGNLYIRAKWNKETDLPETGAIQTKDKLSFSYGKLEVKAKFSRMGQGGWPAIWMMPQNPVFKNWPDGGEIDVMEHLNSDPYAYQVIHQSESEGVEMMPAPFVTPAIDLHGYNTYGLVKTKERIEFYVNDKLTMTYTKGGVNAPRWPFETDFYLILNYAAADKGQSGTNFWPGLVVSPEDFPYEMAVDYVRIWEQEE